MYKVVYNRSFGGFSISRKCAEFMADRGHKEAMSLLHEDTTDPFGDEDEYFHGYIGCPRHDSLLVMAVESLGDAAYGGCADLGIVELRGNKYIINEYDGRESVQEPSDIHWICIK